jgi:AbrB family looped-hinge helix DNA binding protein
MTILYSQVSTKGQMVIPVELREALDLKAGTKVALHLEGNAILVQPITDEFIDSLPGSLKGPSLGAIRERQHRDDKRRDKR